MTCPWCGAELGPSTGIDQGREPTTGDVTICWACVRWSIFVVTAAGLALRRANLWEHHNIMQRPEFEAAHKQAAEQWRNWNGREG